MQVKKKVAQVEELEARLIQEIRHRRAQSRLKLATFFRLAPSTVGIYVDRLITAGYLKEDVVGGKNRHRGRPAQQLYLCGDPGCFVGVEFEAENIQVICVDFAGTIISRHAAKVPPPADANDILNGLERAVRHVLNSKSPRLLGVGIGLPGIIDAQAGIARDYRFPKGREDVLIVQKLTERFRVPVLLENNARAAALGHLLFDPSGAPGDFVSLLIRGGVGAGLIINGALYRGDSFLAGEVGRLQAAATVAPNPPETLEDTASLPAIVHFVRQELKRNPGGSLRAHVNDLAIEHIIEAAREGDELARKGLQRAARAIGWLGHVITLVVNPASIVLTGPLNVLGEWFRLEVQAALNEYAAMARVRQPRVLLSPLNEEAGALGAAGLAINNWKPNRSFKFKARAGLGKAPA